MVPVTTNQLIHFQCLYMFGILSYTIVDQYHSNKQLDTKIPKFCKILILLFKKNHGFYHIDYITL